jgi:predicted transcriptional regulator
MLKSLDDGFLKATVKIVTAYSTHQGSAVSSPANAIKIVFSALRDAQEKRSLPQVEVTASVTHDHIVCLEDGVKRIVLKRYLRSQHGMSPEEYKKKWGLPEDYPMIAPSYRERRKKLSQKLAR